MRNATRLAVVALLAVIVQFVAPPASWAAG
jgi:hypothetical protein